LVLGPFRRPPLYPAELRARVVNLRNSFDSVVAIVGGMGRSIDGSYAEYVCVPRTNVVPIETRLSWEELAAIPEVYATAWACLHRELGISRGQTLLVRGGTSALGQAAINVARDLGLTVLATTRSRERFGLLASLGAEPLVENLES
jgi:NADPH:quinone reductase